MSLIEKSQLNQIATIVIFIILTLLGALSIKYLPVQLTPNIERPQITIINFWRASSPKELESEIVAPQEEQLQSVEDVEQIRASVRAGLSITTVEFRLNADLDRAFINVLNALNQVPNRPKDASEPVVLLGGMEHALASLMIVNHRDPTTKDFTPYQDIIKNTVMPKIRSVEGVSSADMFSFLNRQLTIQVNPFKLAAINLTLSDLINKLHQAYNVSGGYAEVGRRDYTVRFEGKYAADELKNMIVTYSNDMPVHLRDIATVKMDFEESRQLAYRSGQPAFFLQVHGAHNANTIEVMNTLRDRVAQINDQILSPHGLELIISFDSSTHINRAIELVKSNLGFGIVLALIILYAMLRGWRACLIIGTTIPVSLAASLLVLALMGRSLNIVSLAGLAFATGIVLDAAIVVIENIIRLRQAGKTPSEAAKNGTRAVMPALIASTLTTVAIFTPIVFLQGVEGQLFLDLAITMSVSVTASLFNALFLLPVLSINLLSESVRSNSNCSTLEKLVALYSALVNTKWKATAWVILLLPVAVILSICLSPKTDFLPDANWEGIMTVFKVPPGSSMHLLDKELAHTITTRLAPYYQGKKEPAIADFNMSMSSGGNVLFIYPEDPKQVQAILNLLKEEIFKDLPDTQAFSFQASLLTLSSGGTRNVHLNYIGELDDVSRLVAKNSLDRIKEEIPGAIVRTIPGFFESQPEFTLRPDDFALAEAGLSRRHLADMVRAMTDGLYAGEYFDGENRMDVIFKGSEWTTPEQLMSFPISSSNGGAVTLGQVSIGSRDVGPTRLRRLNGQRALSLVVTPPPNFTMEETIAKLNVIAKEAQSQLSKDIFVGLSGGSDDLRKAIKAMGKNFVIALTVLFLLMTGLFKSAKDSILVLLTMPTAILGGVCALWLLNLVSHQSLDLLTMIGFIILLGLVVNNAILLIDQARQGERKGLPTEQAIQAAIHTRIRPIYMSTLTSIVGMLPLATIPGTGSEIYRGLASVIVGGMTFSAFFMVIIISSLMQLTTNYSSHRAQLKPSTPSLT